MLRHITGAMQVLRNNFTYCENIIPSLGKTIQTRLLSTEVEATSQPQPDKLYKRLEIEVRGNDPEVLKSYGIFTCTAAKHLNIEVEKNFAPDKPTHTRMTLLKSKFVHKKHRVQYEFRTYYRFLHFLKLTGSTADTFLEYIQRNLPEGVAMKATRVEIKPLPETVEQALPKAKEETHQVN